MIPFPIESNLVRVSFRHHACVVLRAPQGTGPLPVCEGMALAQGAAPSLEGSVGAAAHGKWRVAAAGLCGERSEAHR